MTNGRILTLPTERVISGSSGTCVMAPPVTRRWLMLAFVLGALLELAGELLHAW